MYIYTGKYIGTLTYNSIKNMYLFLGRIGSTKLVLPKWHKYGALNRVIKVYVPKGRQENLPLEAAIIASLNTINS